jgi:hypothetical protein
MSEMLDVIFRADRKKNPEVTAVFPSECGTDEYDMTCYAHVGQHGSCHRGWYNKTRRALPAEYASLLAELRDIYAPEYTLRVVRKMQQRHAKQRRAQMERMRAAR